eukprot:3122910-Amphidinium_carterae.1
MAQYHGDMEFPKGSAQSTQTTRQFEKDEGARKKRAQHFREQVSKSWSVLTGLNATCNLLMSAISTHAGANPGAKLVALVASCNAAEKSPDFCFLESQGLYKQARKYAQIPI